MDHILTSLRPTHVMFEIVLLYGRSGRVMQISKMDAHGGEGVRSRRRKVSMCKTE